MSKQKKLKSRTELESKITTIFSREIGELPPAFQAVFVDDLVTAFERRLTVFTNSKVG